MDTEEDTLIEDVAPFSFGPYLWVAGFVVVSLYFAYWKFSERVKKSPVNSLSKKDDSSVDDAKQRAMEASRRRQQEKMNEVAARQEEERRKKEREKLAPAAVCPPSKPLRNKDYNPLIGESSGSTFRSSRACNSGGGG